MENRDMKGPANTVTSRRAPAENRDIIKGPGTETGTSARAQPTLRDIAKRPGGNRAIIKSVANTMTRKIPGRKL